MEDKKEFEILKSEELKEIVTAIPHWILRKGNTIILLVILISIVFSYFIKYPETITSEAIITTLDPPQKIYTNVSGKIDRIFVENNDLVKNSQPIALIENSAEYNDVTLLQKTINDFNINMENIYFPIDQLPLLMLGEIDESYSNFENSYIKYELLKKHKDFDIKSESNSFELLENKRKYASLKLKQKVDYSELELKREDLNRYKTLFEKGIVSKQQYEQKQIDFLKVDKEGKNTFLEISETQNEISLSKEKLKLNDIDKIRSEKKVIKDVIQNFMKLKINIKDWEKKYLLKSSREGKISFLKYYKRNDFIKENALFVSIIPQGEFKPVAKLKTSVINSGKIKIGQHVNIKIKNFSYLEYGMLKGKVSNISLVPDDNDKYLIDVEINSNLLTTYNKRLPLRHEMIGEANIITKDLRLIERLLNNLRYLITKNSL